MKSHQRSESENKKPTYMNKEKHNKFIVKKYYLDKLEDKIKSIKSSFKNNTQDSNHLTTEPNQLTTLNYLNTNVLTTHNNPHSSMLFDNFNEQATQTNRQGSIFYENITELNHQRQASLLESSNNVLTTLNNQNTKVIFTEKPKTIEYRNNITNLFQNYKLGSLPRENLTEFEMLKFEDIQKVDFQLRQNTRCNHYETFETVKATVPDGVIVEYYNPLDSLNILKKNSEIMNKIQNEFDNRTKHLLTKSLFEVNKNLEYQKKVPKNIKVTALAFKTENQNDIIIEEKNMEKKKESTEITILPKLSNSGSQKHVEMYGSYVFSRKNFPEGREQFTLTNDLFDVILFGGISANKSHQMWSLDLGIIY